MYGKRANVGPDERLDLIRGAGLSVFEKSLSRFFRTWGIL